MTLITSYKKCTFYQIIAPNIAYWMALVLLFLLKANAFVGSFNLKSQNIFRVLTSVGNSIEMNHTTRRVLSVAKLIEDFFHIWLAHNDAHLVPWFIVLEIIMIFHILLVIRFVLGGYYTTYLLVVGLCAISKSSTPFLKNKNTCIF